MASQTHGLTPAYAITPVTIRLLEAPPLPATNRHRPTAAGSGQEEKKGVNRSAFDCQIAMLRCDYRHLCASFSIVAIPVFCLSDRAPSLSCIISRVSFAWPGFFELSLAKRPPFERAVVFFSAFSAGFGALC